MMRFEPSRYDEILRLGFDQESPKPGPALEELTRYLFDTSIQFVVRYVNVRTLSSEIDLVVQYRTTSSMPSVFDELGSYVVVECKNWQNPVDAKHVRDFVTKLASVRVRAGLLITRSGITGYHRGSYNARREIQWAFDRMNIVVAVLGMDDLESIRSEHDFFALMQLRFEETQFSFLSA
jgi:hypothetical protein